MKIKIQCLRITGLSLSGLAFILAGCGTGILRNSDVRDIHDKTEVELSIGDPKKKVRALLGKPLVDLQSIGVEVYRKAGRDIEYLWAVYPIPMPVPGDKVIGYVLVLYDKHDNVIDIDADSWDGRNNYQITAGKYQIVNARPHEDDTLYGPCVKWLELLDKLSPAWDQRLILIMNDCVTE